MILFGKEEKEEDSEKKERRRRDVRLEHFTLEGGTINITAARRSDSGKYKVKAVNSEGENSLNLEVDVHCK